MTPTFDLTPKQKELRRIISGPERHCLLYGGSRSGKTFLFCYAIHKRALMAAGSRHAIFQQTFNGAKVAVALDTYPKMAALADPGIRLSLNRTDWFFEYPNGAEVWVGGLESKERADKILGREYATMYANECSRLSYDAIVTARSRLAQVCAKADGRPLAQKFYYDLNPTVQSHWTFQEFVKGVAPGSGSPVEGRVWGMANPQDNPHLTAEYLADLGSMPLAQRARFFEGRFLTELPGALWSLKMIEAATLPSSFAVTDGRTVVAIDPPVTAEGDECGLIAARLVGQPSDGIGYILRDGSTNGLSPLGWAKRAVAMFDDLKADRIIIETNQGGDMAEQTLRQIKPNLPITRVHATKGKMLRAEPVSALYEKNRVKHVGSFPDLEEQMTSYTGDRTHGSPDRLDAMVYALTDLFKLGTEAPFKAQRAIGGFV